MSQWAQVNTQRHLWVVKTAILSAEVSMCCRWLDIFLGQSTQHDVLSADGEFFRQLKNVCRLLTTSCSSALSVTSTQDKSKSLPALIISTFLLICSLFVRNQAILSNCEVPGHWTLPVLPPVGKWKISVACNKYFTVGCLCVYISIALKLSPLLPGLFSFEFFVCHCPFSISLLSHTLIWW